MHDQLFGPQMRLKSKNDKEQIMYCANPKVHHANPSWSNSMMMTPFVPGRSLCNSMLFAEKHKMVSEEERN